MSNRVESSILAERLEFSDFGQLAEAASSWDLTLQQVGKGSLRGHLDQVATNHTRVERARFGGRLLQEGSSPAGMLTFGVPMRGSEGYSWRYRRVTSDMLLVFPFEGEFRSITGPGFDSYAITIAPGFLAAVATDLGSLAADRVQRSELVRPNERALAALRAHLRRVLSFISEPDGLDSAGSVIDVETTEFLTEAIADSEFVRRPRVRLRDRALRKAEAVIEAAGKKPMLVSEVCRASGASWRTLNYAFRETHGITVKRYLTTKRLNGLRQDLVHADPGTQVSEVAAAWGFWHMGLLADQYRQLFGELPSATLRRVRTNG